MKKKPTRKAIEDSLKILESALSHIAEHIQDRSPNQIVDIALDALENARELLEKNP